MAGKVVSKSLTGLFSNIEYLKKYILIIKSKKKIQQQQALSSIGRSLRFFEVRIHVHVHYLTVFKNKDVLSFN